MTRRDRFIVIMCAATVPACALAFVTARWVPLPLALVVAAALLAFPFALLWWFGRQP